MKNYSVKCKNEYSLLSVILRRYSDEGSHWVSPRFFGEYASE